MKERPILMRAPMVRAIMQGRKSGGTMTDWNSLDGLELRRAVLELLGGYPDLKMWWCYVDPETGNYDEYVENHPEGNVGDSDESEQLCYMINGFARVAPPIESSADISERVLDEECKKRSAGGRNLTWLVTAALQGHYICIVETGTEKADISRGSNPSIARARAIGILLERDVK